MEPFGDEKFNFQMLAAERQRCGLQEETFRFHSGELWMDIRMDAPPTTMDELERNGRRDAVDADSCVLSMAIC